MGKGDKKTKRGKIIIGSSGVTRMRKKKNNTASVSTKPEPVEKVVAEATAAAKKTSKKADVAEIAEDKAKSSKTKKKATDELPLDEAKED